MSVVMFPYGTHRETLVMVEVMRARIIMSLEPIGVHWSPLEWDNSDGVIIFWTEQCLPLESIGVHWSPLELEIVF